MGLSTYYSSVSLTLNSAFIRDRGYYSARPIVTNVENPDEIMKMFNSVTYRKGYFTSFSITDEYKIGEFKV